MMRMTGAAMMAGSAAVALHLLFQVFLFGMQALEATQLVEAVLDTTIGRSMAESGAPTLVLGTGIQWATGVALAFAYVVAARVVPVLFEFPMAIGMVYGAAAYVFTNFVLPLWIDPSLQLPPLANQFAGLATQAILYGVPMVFAAKMIMRR